LKLKVLKANISTGKRKIAILNYKDTEKLDLFLADRIELKLRNKSTTCILDIAHTERHVPVGRVLLYNETSKFLNAKNNNLVSIKIAKPPESINLIKDKLTGKKLNKSEYLTIIKDIVEDNLSDIELTYFVAACSAHNLTVNEVKHLIDAVVITGYKIKPKSKIVVDKHCVGGVAGNRTTMIVTPLLAAAGLVVPKTSSKAITSPAGTANTMECLANVSLSEKQIERVIKKVGACIVWGGALNLAPADDKIIRIEHPLSIDVSGLLLSSIISKKMAVSATHLLIDIPWGQGSKFITKKEARSLKRKFELITKISNIKCKVVMTDGKSPIGYGLGPALEAMDVMNVLKRNKNAPKDLEDKSIILAGKIFDLVGKTPIGQGKVLARTLLEDGSALRKMNEIIKAQGKKKMPSLGKFRKVITATKSGKIRRIDNKSFSKIAKIAGAPDSKGSGVYIHINRGDKIKKGDKLFTIYSANKVELGFAINYYNNNKKDFVVIT
jgi:thymidine phosphorylase